MSMSYRGISIALVALLVATLAHAADARSGVNTGIKIEGIETFITPSANTTPIPTLPAATLGDFKTLESLEWMAADCDVIVRATVLNAITVSTPLRVEEVLKGNVGGGALLTIEFPEPESDQSRYNSIYRGDVALFFLKENQGVNSSQFPLRARWRESTINLSKQHIYAVSMDCKTFTDPREVVEAVRAASKYNCDRTRKPVSISCRVVPSGGALFYLPPDGRTEKLVRGWIEDKGIDTRLVAVRALQDFKNEQNITLMRRLLSDTQTSSPRGLGKWQVGFFPVRAEAQNLLNEWNVPHEKVSEIGPAYVYQPVAAGRLLIWPGLLIVLVVGLSFLRRRGHRVLVASIVSIVCIAAIGLVWWVWVRSKTVVDEVMFCSASAHHEIASYHGGLQYQLVREWTIGTPLIFGSFDLHRFDDLWSVSALAPIITGQMAGFTSGHGHVVGPAGVLHPYALLRIPYWILFVPFALVLIYQAYILRRQLRRRRLGLCRSCGYDLRENSDGKCPECGTASGTTATNKSPARELTA